MDITVTGRRMNVSDALRDYAEEKIGNSMKAMDIAPLSAEPHPVHLRSYHAR